MDDLRLRSIGYSNTYSVSKSFSVIPLIQEVRLRIKTAFPIQIWTGFRALRNHDGEQGNKKPAKPRPHYPSTGGMTRRE